MKIFVIGGNYAAYNKASDDALLMEKKSGETADDAILFFKPDSALLKDHKPFFIPDDMGPIDCEGQLVVRICRLGKTIPGRFAHRYYDALTVGVDFTARQLLHQLRGKGLPWDRSKGFDGSAMIGDWVAKEKFLDANSVRFHLEINGETAQEGFTGDMLHSIDSLISDLSRHFTLKTGDILFTGSPTLAREVSINDHIEGWIEERKVLDFRCK